MATNGVTTGMAGGKDRDVAVDRVVDVTAEKRRILKNIILISIAFLMTFNAFQGLSRLQSSLHRVDGMGVINSSVLYASLVISCLFLPKLITNAIGHKWTIPISFVGYIVFMAANGYAVWATMVPASIIVGLAAAPLWTAQCSYFTKIARRYSQLADVPEDAVLSRFFGIFFFTFQLSGITGSIISATILKSGTAETNLTDEFLSNTCGANDCPGNNNTNTNLDKPPAATVQYIRRYHSCEPP
ncbi:UNC93-like protein [Lamellibrachia satsuma]|nr:UNC93-like protein [Lamellibrachia satsuma]